MIDCSEHTIERFGTAYPWTAAAYFVIGITMIAAALAVWHTHPVNRVFLFGPYVTQAGIEVLMRYWPMVFMFGAFIFSCAIEHLSHWGSLHGYASPDVTAFFAIVEAVISVATAGAVVWIVSGWLLRKIRAWRQK